MNMEAFLRRLKKNKCKHITFYKSFIISSKSFKTLGLTMCPYPFVIFVCLFFPKFKYIKTLLKRFILLNQYFVVYQVDLNRLSLLKWVQSLHDKTRIMFTKITNNVIPTVDIFSSNSTNKLFAVIVHETKLIYVLWNFIKCKR
jgi:hypothetical protein